MRFLDYLIETWKDEDNDSVEDNQKDTEEQE
jgi:hypothetical protein